MYSNLLATFSCSKTSREVTCKQPTSVRLNTQTQLRHNNHSQGQRDDDLSAKMGAAASVTAGQEIANSIARIHPMFPEIRDPKVQSMFMHYSKKDGLQNIFSNEAGQDSFIRFMQSECGSKHQLGSGVSSLFSSSSHYLCVALPS